MTKRNIALPKTHTRYTTFYYTYDVSLLRIKLVRIVSYMYRKYDTHITHTCVMIHYTDISI